MKTSVRLIIGLMLISSLAFAQSSDSDDSTPKVDMSNAQPEDITNENFPDLVDSFDYPNADIAEVVKAISKLTGKNFILDSNVRGKITIIAPSQITVAEAYRAFLSALAMNGLTVVPSGKFLKIRQTRTAQRDSLETYAGNYFPNSDQMITRIIKLQYINADEVYKTLRILNSKDGEAHAYGPTNSLIITDYGSHIERVTNILKYLDVPGFEEQLAVIRIKYAKAKDIAGLIEKIINKGEQQSGRGVPRFRRTQTKDDSSGSGAESYSLVVADDRTNAVIVVGNKAGIQKIKKLVAQLDFPLRPEDSGGVYVYYVRHGEAEKIANVLNGIASEAKKQQKESGGNTTRSRTARNVEDGEAAIESGAIFGGDVKVTADKDTNSLIISASRLDFDVVKGILNKIDIARDQVFVKAVILEMEAQNALNWGVNYYKFADGTNGIGRIGFSSGNLQDLINPANDSGAVIGFGSGDEVDISIPGADDVTVVSLSGLIKFLKTNVGANILSTPQIMAIDNEEAIIEVGQEVPVGSTTQATSAGTTTSIERKKATIKLTITPYISPDTDNVRMKIDQQISQLTSQKVAATEIADSAVVTNERAIKTIIQVDSGDTAVLGGLMADQEQETIRKIPILGDIPIIGWLFKARLSESRKNNLLVFITPKIIRNNQDNSSVLDEKLDERISFIQRHLNGRDPHGEQIDNLPRKAYRSNEILPEPEIQDTYEDPPEEPAVETF